MKIKSKNNPFAAIIGGIVVIIIAAIMLIWNEGNNVKNIKAVDEARNNLINISSDTIVMENDGKLVSTNGDLIVHDEFLVDTNFNVRSSNTVKMVRYVEMYQWEEDSEKDSDGDTLYTYKKIWSGNVIDSTGFKSGHDNPGSIPYNDCVVTASNVTVGAFTLSENQKLMLTVNKFIPLGNDVYIPSGYTVSGNYITNSVDLNNPQIGDVRIYFKESSVTKVSLIAKQSGNSFVDYISESGKSINKIVSGTYTGEELILQIENENNIFKWIFRIMGIVFMIAGFYGLLSPMLALISIIPLVGKHISRMVGSICSLIGLAVSFVIIAVSWLAYRPLIALALFALVVVLVVLVVFLITKLRKNKEQQNGVVQQPINNYQNNIPVNNGQNINQSKFNNNQMPTQINLEALNNIPSNNSNQNVDNSEFNNINQNNNQF